MSAESSLSTVHCRSESKYLYLDNSGFAFRLLQVPQDIALLHDWLTRDYAAFWQMQNKTREEIATIYQTMTDSGHAKAYLELRHGQPAFMAECYDPFLDRIGQHYEPQPGDLGMHFLIGPTTKPVRGYTHLAFQALMRFMFQHLGAQRIVVEPDVNNHKIHILNRRMGFSYERNVIFEEKIASLAFCTREQFEQAIQAT
ncbi:GNAT family N-acetyltransferase [Pusillimonas sp. ANT_WB101]|uniref:GNAT family N-acetyltransferase n=1 Tax=Pusillimonas sp. ANT_WB101 TaxID=2597356 RepID=UPI002106AC0B|nr:GNAT family N-acetyltransferase [Pusillimonas sp. ANT_WB101]